MATHESASKLQAASAERPATQGPKPARTPAEAALDIQRAAGNRALGRVLARAKAHPDPEKKEEMVPDEVFDALMKFDPPKPK